MGQATELLKRRYSSGEKVENAGLLDTKFLKDVKRTVNPQGESFNSFITVSGGVGWSGNRASAVAISNQAVGTGRGNGSFQQIRNSWGKIAGEVRFQEMLIKATDSGDAAAGRHLLMLSQEHLAQFGPMAESWISHADSFLYLFRGTLSTNGLITLTSNPEHISRVRQDMIIVQGGATPGAALASNNGFVVGIDRFGATPTITVSSSSGGAGANPATWATTAGLYYYALGTHSATGMALDQGVNSAFMIDNFASWCPEAAPSSTPYKTMNRAQDNLLGGVRLTAAEVATMNLLQRAEALAVRGKTRAGWDNNEKMCFVHTIRFNQMQQLLQQSDNRERGYRMSEGRAEYGYNYINMVSTGANIRIVECPMWDPDVMWIIDPSLWNLHSHAGWPSVVNDDGLRMIRDAENDEFRMQYTGYGSLRTHAPHKIGRCPAN